MYDIASYIEMWKVSFGLLSVLQRDPSKPQSGVSFGCVVLLGQWIFLFGISSNDLVVPMYNMTSWKEIVIKITIETVLKQSKSPLYLLWADSSILMSQLISNFLVDSLQAVCLTLIQTIYTSETPLGFQIRMSKQ